MAKTPFPPDGYVSLSATVDERECREGQEACQKAVYAAIGDVNKCKVPWPTFTVILSLCVIFFAIVGIMAQGNQAAIGDLRVNEGVATTERGALTKATARLESVLDKQVEAFNALRIEIRRNGNHGPAGATQ